MNGRRLVLEETKTIAVAAEDESGLDGQVAGHFGRCRAYVVVETLGDRIEGSRVVLNPHAEMHQPGQMPRFIQGLGANVILAGGMGPRAVDMFSQFGIDVATGFRGRVRDVVGGYLRGEVSGTVPCGHDHPRSCGGGHHE